MRRRLSIFGVVALAAATLGAAAPAQAAEATHCELVMRSQDVVEVGSGQINIYPSNAGPYATHVVAAVRAYVNCIVNEAVGPAVACANAFVANRPTVTIDPITLQITIDYEDFMNTQCQV